MGADGLIIKTCAKCIAIEMLEVTEFFVTAANTGSNHGGQRGRGKVYKLQCGQQIQVMT